MGDSCLVGFILLPSSPQKLEAETLMAALPTTVQGQEVPKHAAFTTYLETNNIKKRKPLFLLAVFMEDKHLNTFMKCKKKRKCHHLLLPLEQPFIDTTVRTLYIKKQKNLQKTNRISICIS